MPVKPRRAIRLSLPAVLALSLLGGCGDSTTKDTSTKSAEPAEQERLAPPGKKDVTDSKILEEQLASIDSGSPIVETRKIRRFGFLLDRLQANCSAKRSRLADYAVNTQKMLDEDKGVEQSVGEILEGVTKGASAHGVKRCEELFVLYLAVAGEP